MTLSLVATRRKTFYKSLQNAKLGEGKGREGSREKSIEENENYRVIRGTRKYRARDEVHISGCNNVL